MEGGLLALSLARNPLGFEGGKELGRLLRRCPRISELAVRDTLLCSEAVRLLCSGLERCAGPTHPPPLLSYALPGTDMHRPTTRPPIFGPGGQPNWGGGRIWAGERSVRRSVPAQTAEAEFEGGGAGFRGGGVAGGVSGGVRAHVRGARLGRQRTRPTWHGGGCYCARQVVLPALISPYAPAGTDVGSIALRQHPTLEPYAPASTEAGY